MELAEGLLAMNPAKRLSAKKALETAYFVSEEPVMEKPKQYVPPCTPSVSRVTSD